MKSAKIDRESRVRIVSVDAFRVIANFVIIVVHTRPFMGPEFSEDTRFFGELINQFVRVATPFFFLAAGYFFAASLARGAESLLLARRLIKRLAGFFLFWSLVYILLPQDVWLRPSDATYWEAVHGAFSRALSVGFLLTGSRIHLWFLPALASALALLAASVRVGWQRALLTAAAILYGVGLLAGAYKSTALGFDLGINTRDGPFMSTIFVATGYLLYRADFRAGMRQALLLIVVGTLLRVVEVFWIPPIRRPDRASSSISWERIRSASGYFC